MELVFPGHGMARAPGRLIDAQRTCLVTPAGHVKELAQGQPRLSDAAKKELERRMSAHPPDAGLTFLIGMGADAIARELVSSPAGS